MGTPRLAPPPNRRSSASWSNQQREPTFAITQLFWDADTYVSFVERARACGVTIPVLAGLLPATGAAPAGHGPHRHRGPRGILDGLSAQDDPVLRHRFGIHEGARIAREVLAAGAPGVHLYTLGPALPPPSTCSRRPDSSIP